jgi:DNA invertase Pin-like site-specific DNA recombinase
MIYGYARVSTKTQEDNTSLKNQVDTLFENGCTKIYKEVYTGATMN